MLELCNREHLDDSHFAHFRQLVEDEEPPLDINCTDDQSRTPLILLCEYNNSEDLYKCVQLILRRSDININHRDWSGLNALMGLCCYSKSEEIVQVAQLLIDSGLNVNDTGRSDKRNALMWLCLNSKSEKMVQVAQLLIEKGIDINHTNSDGRHALMLLCKWHMRFNELPSDLMRRFMSRESFDNLKLRHWMSEGDLLVQMAELLIANGIHLNHTDNDGMTSLMHLCRWNKSEKIFEMTKLLVSHGAKVKPKDKEGRNAAYHLQENDSGYLTTELRAQFKLILGNPEPIKTCVLM